MKPNTYVKIASSGIANDVEELMPFIQGEEIMPLQEDESVEVRASVFNEGNIIIFRNRRTREVLSVIHTPHTVYIQEQNKTISTHRPTSSFLFGMGEQGQLEPAGIFSGKIKLDQRFYQEASEELNEVMAYVTSVLEQVSPEVIDATNEFDRFNLRCRKNVGIEPAFAYLQDALSSIGYNLIPVKGSEKTRYEIDYFYLDPIETTCSEELVDEVKDHGPQYDWPIDPDTRMPIDPTSERGKSLLGQLGKSILPKSFGGALDKVPAIDHTRGGQHGPE